MLKIESHGTNYPPMHPNDRCTTVAEFEDEVLEGLQRRARDNKGKPILVNKSLNYRRMEK